MNAKHLATL